MDYDQHNLDLFWRRWCRAFRQHPWKTLIILLVSFSIGACVVVVSSFLAEKGRQWAAIENKIQKIESELHKVASAMETLLIVQAIDRIEDDNAILLNYEPIPQSIRITVGPLVHYPRPNYGYRLEGRKLYILGQPTLDQLKGRLSSGGVTVEYLRKVDLGEGVAKEND